MRLISLGVALAAASSRAVFASAADLPTPPLPPWYPLEAWEITSLSTSHPHDSPYGANESSLLLTISNPSYIPAVGAPHASGGGYVAFNPSTAHCELHFKTDSETPYGHSSTRCVSDRPNDFSGAQWDLILNELHTDLNAPGDYYLSLAFSLSYNATVYGTNGYKRMAAGTSFRARNNLEGKCVDGGLCEYKLKSNSTPTLIQPKLQECKSACG
ncbi:hypothetical protein F4808DRAFT_424479 [Astrocystis sublimbata]|nr:hypothetical protein F4808DRAFT_424479 [Astrocystis sublimbata]